MYIHHLMDTYVGHQSPSTVNNAYIDMCSCSQVGMLSFRIIIAAGKQITYKTKQKSTLYEYNVQLSIWVRSNKIK